MPEFRPSKIYEDVYVASLTEDDKVILQNRSYETIAEIPVCKKTGLLIKGACICQIQKNWQETLSESYWFCLDRNTNKRAIAELWKSEAGDQIVIRQPGSSCED